MKKVLLCICAWMTVLSLAACSGAPASSAPSSVPSSDSQASSVSEAVPESVSEPASEAADADYTAYSITFDVPEGFEQVDASGTGARVIYQAADGSSINVVIMENNGSLASDVVLEDLVDRLRMRSPSSTVRMCTCWTWRSTPAIWAPAPTTGWTTV